MNKKTIKPIIACLLAVLMLLASMPFECISAADYFEMPALFYELLEDGTAEITRCDDALTEITVPESIDGYTVTSIAGDAFYDSAAVSISLPNTLTHIGADAFTDSAFYDNESNWENGMLYIGEYLIAVSEGAPADIVIKDGTKLIADSAFPRYAELDSLTIPASLVDMGTQARPFSFSNGFTVADDNKNYSAVDGSLYNKDRTVLLNYHADQDAEDCVVTIPSTVKKIEDFAFAHSPRTFKEFIIPAALEEMTSNALYPSEFEKITIDSNNKHFAIHGDGFLYNKELTEAIYHTDMPWTSEAVDYVAPKSLKVISDNAFNSCTNLGSVTLPEGLEYIGKSAFSFSSRLAEINIPSTVTYIGEGAFEYTDIYSTYFNENRNGVLYIDNCLVAAKNYDDTELTIQDGTRLIANDTLSYSFKFTSIVLPDSLKIIGDGALTGAKITAINFPEGLEYIGDCAFQYTELADAALPKSLKYIGDYAFYSANLTSVTIPEGLEYMGESAFEFCFDLKELTLLCNSIAKIPDYAFYGCGIEGELVIPDGIKEIGKKAFDCRCDGIVVPKSVEKIGEDAFGFLDYIKGYKGTCAEAYAKENYITFTPLDGNEPSTSPLDKYEIGDANLDGDINIKDATAIQKHVAQLILLEGDALTLADYDEDNVITIKDATAIQKKVAGLI